MPVLKKEAVCYPRDLFTNPAPVARDREWFVLHTRPRSEKAIARQMEKASVPCFLPVYERRYRKQRRLVRSYLPLFPGYVFVLANQEERWNAATSNHVANVLSVPDQKTLADNLQSIFDLVESGSDVAPEDRLEPGSQAEIVAGPMKGRTGTIVRRGTGFRLVLEVNFLQQGASVELDSSDIRWVP